MRRINYYTGNSKEFLHSIGDALHAENKSTYLSIEGELYAKYDEFDDNSTSLENLTPVWVQKTPENVVKIDCAHDMYNRKEKIFQPYGSILRMSMEVRSSNAHYVV
jgi:hypothetical protein